MEKHVKRKYDKKILFRVLLLTFIFGLGMFVPLFIKLYSVMIVDHDRLESEAIRQQTKSDKIIANRGYIYDRNMNVLAVSASVERILINPSKIKDEAEAELIADGLSRILEVDKAKIIEQTKKKERQDETIRRQVEKELADEVRKFITDNKLNGKIEIVVDMKRYYPNGSFASTVIGFVGTDNTGLMGLEALYDDELTGTPGYTISAKDGTRSPMSNQYEMYYDAQDGNSLVLSIDETIQHFLEKNLETAVIENEVANRACGIVMDVKTGAILAMSTKGDFDLNEPRVISDDEIRSYLEQIQGTDTYSEELYNAQQNQWRNKAISDTYEPGSTFKIFTAAMAIEENVVNLDTDRFSCGGSVQVGVWTINCHKRAGHGSQSFLESLLHSCNPAFINIGARIGPEKFYSYMQAFGFMDSTGVDLLGETSNKGLYHSYETYSKDPAAQAVYSFGQTFKITPLQLITAVCAVANGGNLMKPHIVSQQLDRDGNILSSVTPEVVRQVISAETSEIMRGYLEQCVSSGTGSNAYVKGYRVAGKTGTSQKRDIAEASELGLYVTSFVGFAPADDPQVAILIMLDEPGLERSKRTGGFMAAPVAGRVLSDTLPYLGVMPQYNAGEIIDADVTVPLCKNMTVDDAKKAAAKAGFGYEVIGNGDKVIDQVPSPGVRVPASAKIKLYTEEQAPGHMVSVPDVSGMSPEQANTALTNAGLFIRPIGAQPAPGVNLTAAWQEYKDEAPYGTVVQVEFRDSSVQDMGTTQRR